MFERFYLFCAVDGMINSYTLMEQYHHDRLRRRMRMILNSSEKENQLLTTIKINNQLRLEIIHG